MTTVLDTLFSWLGEGRYESTLPTIIDGQTEKLHLDQNARLHVNVSEQAKPAVWYNETGLVREKMVYSGVCNLFEIVATNTSGSTVFLFVFDLAVLQSNGATSTIWRRAIPAGQTIVITPPGGSKIFNTGITLHASSTCNVLTKIGSDDVHWSVGYSVLRGNHGSIYRISRGHHGACSG